ncbi:MAG TPA: hypothetical protein VF230_11240 [Acidimicrobiales bacterium]
MYIEPYEVAVRLDRLGMPADLLHEAGRRGHVDRRFASPLDFPGRGEYDAASTGLRTICEEGGTLTSAWHRATYLGIPVAFNLDETVAIAVTSGDEFTGINGDRDPRTRPIKGPNAAVAAARQGLPLLRGYDADGDGDDRGVELWYVLTYVDAERVRMEISQSALVEDGYVTGWHERVILAGVDLDGVGLRPTPVAPTPPLEINPVRKSG